MMKGLAGFLITGVLVVGFQVHLHYQREAERREAEAARIERAKAAWKAAHPCILVTTRRYGASTWCLPDERLLDQPPNYPVRVKDAIEALRYPEPGWKPPGPARRARYLSREELAAQAADAVAAERGDY